MGDWRDDIDRGLQELQDQGEMLMSLRVLPANYLDATVEAGNNGDMEARAAIIAIVGWFQMVEKAYATGSLPGCGTCAAELPPGTVCGWIIMTPQKQDAMGLVSPLCESCIALGRDEVIRRFRETLSDELNGELQHVQ